MADSSSFNTQIDRGIQMPCVGPSDDSCVRTEYVEVRKQSDVQMINKLTALLCDSCRSMVQANVPLSAELQAWYEIHKEEDDHRIRREERERAIAHQEQRRKEHLESVKRRLMNQLTDDEKESIGLK